MKSKGFSPPQTHSPQGNKALKKALFLGQWQEMNTGKSSLPSSSCCGADAGGGCHVDPSTSGEVTRNGGLGASEIFHKKCPDHSGSGTTPEICTDLLGIKSKKLYEQKQDFGEAKRFLLEGSNSSFVFWIWIGDASTSGHREKTKTFQTSSDFRAFSPPSDGGRHLCFFSGCSSGIQGVLYWGVCFGNRSEPVSRMKWRIHDCWLATFNFSWYILLKN